ncbi:hypothetical protein GGX14DRAFT_470115, partial [Mycena pura]
LLQVLPSLSRTVEHNIPTSALVLRYGPKRLNNAASLRTTTDPTFSPLMVSTMHPDLGLDALKKLPLYDRHYAKMAARGSMPDMDKVISRSELPELSHLFLPVVFANLDPSRIPGAQLLDTAALPPTASSPIILALQSLDLLTWMDKVDPAAYTALWPRAWQWIQFLEVYHAFLPEPQTFAEVGARIVASLRNILVNRSSAAAVHSTPGVYRLFAQIWIALPSARAIVTEANKARHAKAALLALYCFIGDSLWTPNMVFEFVEGAGGADALASRLVAAIATYVPPLRRVAQTPAAIFASLMKLVRPLVQLDQPPMPLEHLLASGLTRAVTHTLLPLCAAATATNDFCLAESSLRTLVIAFTSPVWFKYLPESLEAGLLPALVAIMQSPAISDVVLHLVKQIVCDILPGAFLFRSVVAAVRGRVPDATDPRRFRSMALYTAWVKIQELAVERVDALNFFESAAHMRVTMCDNPECQQIKAIKQMKKCSSCLLQYYCGRECQKSAWKLKHREHCASVREAINDELDPLEMLVHCRRTDRFLRFLVLRDYRAQKLQILLDQLELLHRNRSAQLMIPEDYRQVMRAELNTGGRRRTGWHHIIFYAAGKLDCKERRNYYDYLLRSRSTALTDGLLRLADLLPEDADVSRLEWDWPEVYAEVVRLSQLEIEEFY